MKRDVNISVLYILNSVSGIFLLKYFLIIVFFLVIDLKVFFGIIFVLNIMYYLMLFEINFIIIFAVWLYSFYFYSLCLICLSNI